MLKPLLEISTSLFRSFVPYSNKPLAVSISYLINADGKHKLQKLKLIITTAMMSRPIIQSLGRIAFIICQTLNLEKPNLVDLLVITVKMHILVGSLHSIFMNDFF